MARKAPSAQDLLGSSKRKAGGRQVPEAVTRAFRRLEDARAKYSEFYAENAKVIEECDQHRATVDACINDAKAAYAANVAVLGEQYEGFSVTKKRFVDADLLVKLMPDAFGLVKLSMPVADLDKYVESGVIPEDLAGEVEGYTQQIKAPKR